MSRVSAGEGGAPWCSFCGRSHREVEHVISAPNAWICNECVDLCVEIITQQRAKRLAAQPQPKEQSNAV